MIERTEPMRVAHNVIIGLCRRALKLNRAPTAEEIVEWSKSDEGRQCISLNVKGAQYLLDNPNMCFGEGNP